MLCVICASSDRWVQHVYLKNEIKNEMQEGREREREKTEKEVNVKETEGKREDRGRQLCVQR